jgi:hypothetical protein
MDASVPQQSGVDKRLFDTAFAIPRPCEVIRPLPKAARCALAEEDFEAP